MKIYWPMMEKEQLDKFRSYLLNIDASRMPLQEKHERKKYFSAVKNEKNQGTVEILNRISRLHKECI